MVRIFRRLWQVNWAEQWQYRANLIMYLLYWLVSPIIYLAVWTSIAGEHGTVSGLTRNDFVTYYMALLIIDQLTSEITIHIFAYKIQDGTLSGELIRPIHPILTNTLVNNIAFKGLTMLVMIPVWIVLWLLFRPDFASVNLQSVTQAIPFVVLGFGTSFLLGAALTCVGFWTTRVWSLTEFYWSLAALFSGQFVPLVLMPPIIQDLARFLPFPLFRYYPIQIVLGRFTPEEANAALLSGLVWLAVAFALFKVAWRFGVRRFSAVGA